MKKKILFSAIIALFVILLAPNVYAESSLPYTPCCLINDTLTITRGINSKYTKKYDVEYEYKCLINI